MEIAGAVVGAVTTHAINVVENEIGHASDFGAQLKRLIQFLQHIDGFLHDKEGLKKNANVVKPAMIPLRALIYKADDIITDCIINDEYKDCGFSRGVFGNYSTSTWKFRHNTGKMLKDINSQLNSQLDMLGKFLELKKNTQGDDLSEIHEEDIMSQDFNPDDVIGLEDDIKKIKNWIIKDDNLGHYRFAVSGMGGLGKTTVVQKIFNDDEVSRYFGTRIWVTVSKHFNESKILTSILSKLGRKIPDSNSQLLREVSEAVKKEENGCLIVMDDVWNLDKNIESWNKICATLEVKGQKSCIVVTTRHIDVAKIVVQSNEDLIHKPAFLNTEYSWKLFSKFARPRPEFEGEGKKIADKCGGLPLSLKTIGSLMSGKPSLSEWIDVAKYFHDNPEIAGIDQVIERLRLSYDDLDAHLKQCLLCFSAYPEDSDINADQVIHWWLAEGLLEKQGSKRSALELGRQYLSALIGRCLIEVKHRRPYDGRVYTCKIHDTVRELLMKIAQEEGFCAFNEQGAAIWNDKSYWLCLNEALVTEKESSSRGRANKSVKDDELKFLSFEENSKLRAVLLMPDQKINLNKGSGKLESLRMLDLSGGTVKQDPKLLKSLWEWIENLTRLACLNLSGFEGLEELPASIKELRNLQLLVLSGCLNLKKLPESISRLRKLIVLHLDSCPQLEYLPRDVGKLYKLQELSGFKVTIGGVKTNKGTCGLSELANFTELRVLHIVIGSDPEADLSEITDEGNETLSGMKHLKTLGIDALKFKNGLHILNRICPPETLSELYLQHYNGNMLPSWIDPSQLKSLQYLCIEDAENVAKWNSQPLDWDVLQGVRLKDMQKLSANWAELKEKMPALNYLEVIKCDKLSNLPEDGIKNGNGIWRASKQRA